MEKMFRYCLNTGTIRGQKLGLVREIEVAAKAGYEGIEPWVNDIDAYVRDGGSLKELRARLDDAGLTLESAIGFSQWIAEDEGKRQAGLADARRVLDMLAELGGKRLAAPPSGATDDPKLDLRVVAERYRGLLEAGAAAGVVPVLEVWGFSRNITRLSEALFIAAEAGHPDAAILGDVYHFYKGGTSFEALRLIGPRTMPIFHMNDYPADPPRDRIGDGDRVMPGDGIAPLGRILGDLVKAGGETVLSLELFSRKYWEMDPVEVATLGLAKMKQAVASASA